MKRQEKTFFNELLISYKQIIIKGKEIKIINGNIKLNVKI